MKVPYLKFGASGSKIPTGFGIFRKFSPGDALFRLCFGIPLETGGCPFRPLRIIDPGARAGAAVGRSQISPTVPAGI